VILLLEYVLIRICKFYLYRKQLITGSLDKSVLLWNLENPEYRPIKLLGHTQGVFDVSLSPNGTLIASCSSDQTLKIWDNSLLWQGHTFQSYKQHSAPIKSCNFSCDNKLIVTGSNDTLVKIFNVVTKKSVSTLSAHTNWLKCTRFSNDGNLIISCGDDKKAIIWDVVKELPVQTYIHPGFVNCARFHPDDTCFATSCHDKKIRVSKLFKIDL
jgi:centriolar protein POC1